MSPIVDTRERPNRQQLALIWSRAAQRPSRSEKVRSWTEWTGAKNASCSGNCRKYFTRRRLGVIGGQFDQQEHLLIEQVAISAQRRLESFRIKQLQWACSSAGRAPALQAGGQGFESPHVHQNLTSLVSAVYAAISASPFVPEIFGAFGATTPLGNSKPKPTRSASARRISSSS
jgi:hypothetical protein